MKTYIPELTKILLAKTQEFQVYFPGKEPVGKDDIRLFSFKFEISDGLLLDENLVRLELLIEIRVLLSQNRKPKKSGMLRTEFIFEVEDLPDWIKMENEKALLDPYLAATLAGLAYSTTRGILITKTAGTFLEGCVLPVINPVDLLQK